MQLATTPLEVTNVIAKLVSLETDSIAQLSTNVMQIRTIAIQMQLATTPLKVTNAIAKLVSLEMDSIA